MNSNVNIAHEFIGLPIQDADSLIIWAHGWGHTRTAFIPFAESLSRQSAHLLVDFPGFGQSPLPPAGWGTADYADAMSKLVEPYRHTIKKIFWVGHSFGCRVGIQLAARHPQLVDGLCLIAAAGLPRQRTLLETLRYWARIYSYKILKKLAPLLGIDTEKLRGKFGSSDYKSAGEMRAVFLNVIRENLSEQARQIQCPVQLIYGENDKDTPPDIGERLVKLIPKAELSILPGQDHYSLLGTGRHLVLKRLADFMKKL